MKYFQKKLALNHRLGSGPVLIYDLAMFVYRVQYLIALLRTAQYFPSNNPPPPTFCLQG